jgi:hypothetical protein
MLRSVLKMKHTDWQHYTVTAIRFYIFAFRNFHPTNTVNFGVLIHRDQCHCQDTIPVTVGTELFAMPPTVERFLPNIKFPPPYREPRESTLKCDTIISFRLLSPHSTFKYPHHLKNGILKWDEQNYSIIQPPKYLLVQLANHIPANQQPITRTLVL